MSGEAKKTYTALQSDQPDAKSGKNGNVIPIAIDYMQNISMPKVLVQELFYLRQLTVNIFCIHNIKSNKAVIYIYHEGQARKGPDEVCSFLLHFLRNVPAQFDEVHLFSDNCAGQNKNHPISKFLLSLTDLKKFKTIQHFFPTRGHSFLPCDRNFAIIKRALHKQDRIYSIKQLIELIILSSSSLKFTVVEVKPEFVPIYNFKGWWQKYYKKNPVSVETANQERDKKVFFGISNLYHFIYDQKHPGVVTALPFINGIITHTFSLRHDSRTSVELPSGTVYPEGKVSLKKQKVNDIKKVIPYIEEEFKEFYEQFEQWPQD